MGLRNSFWLPRPDQERKHAPHFRLGSAWIWHILYISYCFEVGLSLLIFPWLDFWDNNYFLYRYPSFRTIVANLFLKIAVFGLGIVNIVIGAQESVQLKKGPKGLFSK